MRQLRGNTAKFVTVLAVAASLYHMAYAASIFDRLRMPILPVPNMAISLGSILILTLLLKPSIKGATKNVPWYDFVLVALIAAGCGYYAFGYELVLQHGELGYPSTLDVVMGVLVLVGLLEAVRRVMGVGGIIVGLFFLLHMFFSNYLPGFLHGRGYSFYRGMGFLFLTGEGIWGTPMRTAATIIMGYIIFGSFLNASGAGKFFTDVALSLFGSVRGGPAKAAILASALFGTLSGSSSANVAVTGVVTIPLMKSIGYRPHFAAAVEAVASNGGIITPPVMGAIAFIMADFLSIPYWKVCIAAAIPAFLYYLAIFMQVDFEAAKLGLAGIPKSQAPHLKETMIKGGYWLLPLLLLIYLLVVVHYSPVYCALWALVLTVILSLFKKETRLGREKMVHALRESAVVYINVGPACGIAGVIMGSAILTGIGFNLSGGILTIAGQNVFFILVLSAISIFVLGMGMLALPCYIIMVTLVGPALTKAGVLPLAAHMFLVFWGIVSFITPPVCTTTFTAAGIAESNPWQTGMQAVRLGIIAFLVPFMFVYNPELLAQGQPAAIALRTISAMIGVVGLSAGLEGYIFARMHLLERALFALAGVAMMAPGLMLPLAGGIVIALLFLVQMIARRLKVGATLDLLPGRRSQS